MKTNKIRLTKEEKSQLFEMYKTGKYTGKDLAKVFPISSASILALLKRHGYKITSQSELQRKYPIKEDFFDVINTQEKAYILGLFYADGCNQAQNNTLTLSLKESDKHILERITELIQPDKPLKLADLSYMRKKEGYENSKDQYKLFISNKHIHKRLIELGCVPAKTLIIKFPTEEQVPKHLQNHFIRGYFDGDGYVSKGKQKEASIVGTNELLKEIQNILNRELNFRYTKLKYKKSTSKEIAAWQVGGIHQCIKFREWLYKDSIIHLNRKKEVFDSYKVTEKIEKKCSLEGCDKKHISQSYCQYHYDQYRRGGLKQIN